MRFLFSFYSLHVDLFSLIKRNDARYVLITRGLDTGEKGVKNSNSMKNGNLFGIFIKCEIYIGGFV